MESAEEFAINILYDCTEHATHIDTTIGASYIRSRDREIVGKCSEILEDNVGMDGRIGLQEALILLNAVLRDLG